MFLIIWKFVLSTILLRITSMAERIRLTIIVPIIKADKTIDSCLLSILGQVAINDFEVVCAPVKDNEESTRRILDAWIKRDRRVKLLPSESSVVDAMNNALHCAKGEFIMFMRQSDVLSSTSNLLKLFARSLRGNPDLCILAQELRQTADFLWEQPAFIRPQADQYSKLIDNKSPRSREKILLSFPPVPWEIVYRKAFIDEQGIEFSTETVLADLQFYVTSVLKAGRIYVSSLSIISFSESLDYFSADQDECLKTHECIEQILNEKLVQVKSAHIAASVISLYRAYLTISKGRITSSSPLSPLYIPPVRNSMTWKERTYKILTDLRALLK